MSKKRTQTWKPATDFHVTKLKANGPKPGQSTDAFIYGKTKRFEKLIDNPRTKFKDLP